MKQKKGETYVGSKYCPIICAGSAKDAQARIQAEGDHYGSKSRKDHSDGNDSRLLRFGVLLRTGRG